MSSPEFFYRVEHDGSQGRFTEGEGIYAKNQRIRISFRFPDDNRFAGAFDAHLYWPSRRPSPFISTTESLSAAYAEAWRCIEAGEQNVTIYKINVFASRKRLQYRHVPLLLEKLDLDIDECAQHRSEVE